MCSPVHNSRRVPFSHNRFARSVKKCPTRTIKRFWPTPWLVSGLIKLINRRVNKGQHCAHIAQGQMVVFDLPFALLFPLFVSLHRHAYSSVSGLLGKQATYGADHKYFPPGPPLRFCLLCRCFLESHACLRNGKK